MKQYFFLIALILISCDVKDPQSIKVRESKPTLYPIITTRCRKVPESLQDDFPAKFQKLRVGMTSESVVKLLGLKPSTYRPNDSKSYNAPIRSYYMIYDFDCKSANGRFIILYFSPDEKLYKILSSKNIYIANLDDNIEYEWSTH